MPNRRPSIDQLEAQDFFALQVVPCARCGAACYIPGASNSDARLLRAATDALGVCPACHITAFLQDKQFPFREFIEARGVDVVLRDPRVQQQIAEVVAAANADVPASQIDWERVITNWDLPHPKRKRTKRGKQKGR